MYSPAQNYGHASQQGQEAYYAQQQAPSYAAPAEVAPPAPPAGDASPLQLGPPLASPGSAATPASPLGVLRARLKSAGAGVTIVTEGVQARLRELEQLAATLEEENRRLRQGVGAEGGKASKAADLDLALLRSANEDLKAQLERERRAQPDMNSQATGQLAALIKDKAALKAELDASRREAAGLKDQLLLMQDMAGGSAGGAGGGDNAKEEEAAEEVASPGGTGGWPEVDGGDDDGWGGDWGSGEKEGGEEFGL